MGYLTTSLAVSLSPADFFPGSQHAQLIRECQHSVHSPLYACYNDCEDQPAHVEGSAFACIQIDSTALSGDCEPRSGHPYTSWYSERDRFHDSCLGHVLRFDELSYRIGEAQNPGPSSDLLDADTYPLRIGTSNSTGIRQKEKHMLDLGFGIWCFAETHLTAETYKNAQQQIRFLSAQQGRAPKLLTGAFAAYRTSSRWAGTWTGVAQLTDLPAWPLNLGWPEEQWATARVQASRQWFGRFPLTVCTVYGYPTGPTWPKAKMLTESILQTLTTDIVLGMDGFRVIAGDYNHEAGSLLQHEIWRQHGWQCVQCHAEELWGQQRQPTCKNRTQRDQIWCSPEALAVLKQVEVQHIFADHSTVIATFALPLTTQTLHTWPRPAKIEWDQVQENYSETTTTEVMQIHGSDTTTQLSAWAKEFECGVAAHYIGEGGLPGRCQGRCQRFEPKEKTTTAQIVKPSRPGEIRLHHDAIGQAVRLWFIQARRLQSLLFAVQASKMSLDALEYRISLWSAILRAKGFHLGFQQWWQSKETLTEDGNFALPVGVPGLEMAHLLYEEFMAHFRRFERLHLQERGKKLKEKYERSLHHLQRDLRAPARNTPELFWQDLKFEVVDAEAGQVKLEPRPAPHKDAQWLLDGAPIHVHSFDGALCQIDPEAQVGLGDQLVQRIFTTSIEEMHNQLIEFWKPRWQRLADVPPSQWQRIVDFTAAYMPRLTFTWFPITGDDLKDAAKHMKVAAARGSDGLARMDILRMSPTHRNGLAWILNQVELHDQPWPRQFLLGLVITIAKTQAPSGPSGYRPITLFSVVFRLWSSIRTRQLLQVLRFGLPDSIYGFVPFCEASQIWEVLQGQIEVALNANQEFSGLSADVEKAFNYIGRDQLFYLADKINIPAGILRPWKAFVSNAERRFDVRGCVSEPLCSTSGFFEGDPLSIVAMLLINWGHHQYLAQFVPKIKPMTYVDNLTLVAPTPGDLLQGLFATRSFYALWGLSLDENKTVTWALSTPMRSELKAAGLPVLKEAMELGGNMNYTRMNHNHLLKDRGIALQDRWVRLRRSAAPQWRKVQSLAPNFWSAALHGAGNCELSTHYITELRRKATKAIGLNTAGSNPMLRLSLSGDAVADPGYYQLKLVFYSFLRLYGKSDDFQMSWHDFWHQESGRAPGPFRKLVGQLQEINWIFTAPDRLEDHTGRQFHLLYHDQLLVRQRLQEGWLQKVAHEVRHKTMRDLAGLDGELTLLDHGKLLRIESARVSALHSGAFVSNSQKGKFDVSKTPFCSECNMVDDRCHWLSCPKMEAHRQHFPWNWATIQSSLPDCTIFHLLVPQIPDLDLVTSMLADLPLNWTDFQTSQCISGIQHLFTDGTCTREPCSRANYAAWGVLHAGTGQVLSTGHLSGARQAIDRAELTALVSATAWTAWQDQDSIVWSDSQSTVKIAQTILNTLTLQAVTTNLDLWQEFLLGGWWDAP